MFNLFFLSPIISMALSLLLVYILLKIGVKKKIVCLSQVASFVLLSASMILFSIKKITYAEETAAISVVPADKAMSFAVGLIGAALAVGLAALATGIALSSAVPAAIAAMSENEKTFGKSMVFAIFGEAIVLYGFIISFLILNNLKFLVGVA